MFKSLTPHKTTGGENIIFPIKTTSTSNSRKVGKKEFEFSIKKLNVDLKLSTESSTICYLDMIFIYKSQINTAISGFFVWLAIRVCGFGLFWVFLIG